MASGSVIFVPDPRSHADGVGEHYGSSRDARLVYDGAADEWRLQTRNAAGAWVTRLSVRANADDVTVALANGLRLGNSADGVAGTLRWSGSALQYHDGTGWVTIDALDVVTLLDTWQWTVVPVASGWATAVTGSGTVGLGIRNLAVITGSTAGSTARAYTSENVGWNRGLSKSIINWSKRVELYVVLNSPAATTNGVSRLTLGKHPSDGVGPLADKGVGLQVDNLALKGIAHDGTAGTTVDLASSLSLGVVELVKIVSDGLGNVQWYVNGVLKGSTTAGPTGTSGTDRVLLQVEADNGPDAAIQNLSVNDVKIYVEQ